MSIQRITPDNVEFFTIETNPSKSYSSRPRLDAFGAKIYVTGVFGRPEPLLNNTGSINLFAIRSPIEKETLPLGFKTGISFDDQSFEQLRRSILDITASNFEASMNGYLSTVNQTSESLRKQQKLEIIRFTPSFNFTSNTVRKNLILNHLMPFYRPTFPAYNFSYANYNSLHFFTSGSSPSSFSMPSSSVLLYPNPPTTRNATPGDSGSFLAQYGIGRDGEDSEPFSFDFWIKPKYTVDEGQDYKAGTVLHLSSTYAVSIHSGSSRDINGRPNKFKIMLQLGAVSNSLGFGSGLPPSQELLVNDRERGVWLSEDNVLNLNEWSHVTIRFPGWAYNLSSGSFVVNGRNVGYLTSPHNGIGDGALYPFYGDTFNNITAAYALCVGNFYEGPAISDMFFNTKTAERDGLLQLNTGIDEPDSNLFRFNHPLNAEVHDLKIYNKYLTDPEIEELDVGGPKTLDNLIFYLPPFFTEESPFRRFVDSHGGELITPFFERDGTTTTPFAADMAFGCGGHYPNLENYVRDFVTGNYPRLWHLTASSIIPGNSVVQTANNFLYASSSHVGANKKRLYTILPCDHGNFQPNFNLLSSMSGALSGRYTGDFDSLVPGLISLKNIVSGADDLASRTIIENTGSILDDVIGTKPEDISRDPGYSLTMMHRLRDDASNQVVVFDVSNLFYGNQIKPGSLVLTDPELSGSDGKFGMVLKDDGLGNLYRADATGTHATWASVGNIFYDEGLVLIKHPNLFFFGEEGFDISFRGIQNIHVYTISAFARSMQLISSSNTDFPNRPATASDLTNEPDQNYVYITGINVHDENLNVIAKSALAQPILKRTGDKMVFRIRMDY